LERTKNMQHVRSASSRRTLLSIAIALAACFSSLACGASTDVNSDGTGGTRPVETEISSGGIGMTGTGGTAPATTGGSAQSRGSSAETGGSSIGDAPGGAGVVGTHAVTGTGGGTSNAGGSTGGRANATAGAPMMGGASGNAERGAGGATTGGGSGTGGNGGMTGTAGTTGGASAVCPDGITQTITVAKDGSGQFSTVQAAVNSIASGSSARIRIDIKAGTYTEKLTIASRTNLCLVGAGAINTILTYGDSNAAVGSTSGSASVLISANDFSAANLTISRKARAFASSRAQARARTPRLARFIN
jgi:hypothetical protein